MSEKMSRLGTTPSVEQPYPDVLVEDGASRVVALEGNGPRPDAAAWKILCAVPVRRLSPVHHFAAVYFHRDRIVFGDDVFGEPLVILHQLRMDILHFVQAAGAARIPGKRVVHLNFEALGGPAAILIFG